MITSDHIDFVMEQDTTLRSTQELRAPSLTLRYEERSRQRGVRGANSVNDPSRKKAPSINTSTQFHKIITSRISKDSLQTNFSHMLYSIKQKVKYRSQFLK